MASRIDWDRMNIDLRTAADRVIGMVRATPDLVDFTDIRFLEIYPSTTVHLVVADYSKPRGLSSSSGAEYEGIIKDLESKMVIVEGFMTDVGLSRVRHKDSRKFRHRAYTFDRDAYRIG